MDMKTSGGCNCGMAASNELCPRCSTDNKPRFPNLGERNRQQEIVEHCADLYIRVAGQTVSLHDLAKHNPGAAFAEAFRLAGIPAPRVDTVAEAGNAPAPESPLRPVAEIAAALKTMTDSLTALQYTPSTIKPISITFFETLRWVLGEVSPPITEILDTHAAIVRKSRSRLQ